MNNTSVILLIHVPAAGGDRSPAVLRGRTDRELGVRPEVAPDAEQASTSSAVDLYKVGHHGSRNATPRTLFNLWSEPATRTGR